MQALVPVYPAGERVFNTSQRHDWGKRKLKRDQ